MKDNKKTKKSMLLAVVTDKDKVSATVSGSRENIYKMLALLHYELVKTPEDLALLKKSIAVVAANKMLSKSKRDELLANLKRFSEEIKKKSGNNDDEEVEEETKLVS